ncbi:N-acetyltransferase [Pelagibius litoralis]|uniref:N-acetyltransferase n=1 Tax=Pelagibius litoralis TaxID=374515 RepID=A0A967C3E4_9PROT|nr:N-acetyltransferase [Pelagibius litoralis]
MLRDARPDDCSIIQKIYAEHVINGVASFEETPPSLDEMRRRLDSAQSRGLPYLVAEPAESPGAVLGFATVGAYRTRPAYRFSLENTVYVRDGQGGRGIGGLLLGRLIERCENLGFRQMIAVIGDSKNEASIRLHRRHGFEPAGCLRSVGFKHGRWLDSVLMQRALGPGDTTMPKP